VRWAEKMDDHHESCLTIGKFHKEIFILDLPLSFGATGCTRELSHKRKLSLLFATRNAASSLAPKDEKCLNLLKYAWLTGF
jgi:hypothetical protein